MGVVMRFVVMCALATALAGCARTETVQFKPRPEQQSMMRDGQAALISRRKHSLVLIRPAARQFQTGARPVYVVGLSNLTGTPQEFRVSNVGVNQTVNGSTVALKVITFEELMTEERNRQIAAAVITGLAVGANAYSASRAGHYSQSSTVTTSRGNVYQVHTTGYSPTANAIAQSNAAAQNEAMISATVERGQQNMAALEQGVIKDNTLLPGEWYGGQLHIQPLVSEGDGAKTYTITMMVGTDRHEIDVSQIGTR
jgi:hypothetical protein